MRSVRWKRVRIYLQERGLHDSVRPPMITPIVHESDWLTMLSDLPRWELPRSPVLLVVPHPDDESLATGGLLAALSSRGVDTLVVAVTDGENAYEDVESLGAIRREEQEEALRRLGVSSDSIIRLGLPDSSVSLHEEELTSQLVQLSSSQTHVLAPWPGDFHPDHEACGRAAIEAARATGAKLTFYFFWTWHRGTLDLLRREELSVFPLDDEMISAKQQALFCHASQLERSDGDPILNERLLEPARRTFEVFLNA
jgi:LmbE family N-acetylglucosaminyl deacetylase